MIDERGRVLTETEWSRNEGTSSSGSKESSTLISFDNSPLGLLVAEGSTDA